MHSNRTDHMKGFEILDISGDIGIKAFGKSVEEVFINAAIGMYSLITNTDAIQARKTIDISVESHSLEGLLVSWLNELIFHFDTYGFIGKEIEIAKFIQQTDKNENHPANQFTATVYGEEFNPERHERRLLIKAATYHRLRVENINNRWEIDIIFDI